MANYGSNIRNSAAFATIASSLTASRLAADELAAARTKYLRDWTLVKRARFNAAKRYERKHRASTLALAMAGMIGIVVPYMTQMFKLPLGGHYAGLLDFYAYIAGAFSLATGLVEQARGYDALSRRFDECGRRVNAALRKLRNVASVEEAHLAELVSEYERALDVCDVNHDDIDWQIALTEEDCERARGRGRDGDESVGKSLEEAQRRMRNLRWQETAEIFWLYWVVILLPLSFLVTLWLLLPEAPGGV